MSSSVAAISQEALQSEFCFVVWSAGQVIVNPLAIASLRKQGRDVHQPGPKVQNCGLKSWLDLARALLASPPGTNSLRRFTVLCRLLMYSFK